MPPWDPGDPPGTPHPVLPGSTCAGPSSQSSVTVSVPPSRPHARSRPELCSLPTSLLGLAQPPSPPKKGTCRAVSPPPPAGPTEAPAAAAHRGRRLSHQGPARSWRSAPRGRVSPEGSVRRHCAHLAAGLSWHLAEMSKLPSSWPCLSLVYTHSRKYSALLYLKNQ